MTNDLWFVAMPWKIWSRPDQGHWKYCEADIRTGPTHNVWRFYTLYIAFIRKKAKHWCGKRCRMILRISESQVPAYVVCQKMKKPCQPFWISYVRTPR